MIVFLPNKYFIIIVFMQPGEVILPESHALLVIQNVLYF